MYLCKVTIKTSKCEVLGQGRVIGTELTENIKLVLLIEKENITLQKINPCNPRAKAPRDISLYPNIKVLTE
jgi:hypothetical protein